MLMKIIQVHNHGKANEEFVHMKVNESCKLDHFILTDTTYKSPIQKSNKHRHLYWWQNGKIAAKGDHVFVFTGVGTDSSKKNEDGTTSWYYYWNLNAPVWNDTGDLAILIQIQEVQNKPASDKT